MTSIQGLIAYATAKKAGGVIAYRRVRGVRRAGDPRRAAAT
ncbi:Uncharacterised protein [Mycobacterium tuberculosis]|nr:Uncharacterised protein [Mycobacterium tuberculosis]